MIVTKTVDCSIAGWTYMDPMRQQMYGQHRSRCNSPNLYWYPQLTSNMQKCPQERLEPPKPAIPPIRYSWPAQNQPPIPKPWPAFPPPMYSWLIHNQPLPPSQIHPLSISWPYIPFINPYLLPHYPPTSQPSTSSTPQFNFTTQATNSSTPFSTPFTPTTQPLVQSLPIKFPFISNNVPEILQTSLQPSNFPGFPSHFPVPVPLSFPPVPQIGLSGLPGLVSSDGGINIMPFSDVYNDLYEKFKNKAAWKELR